MYVPTPPAVDVPPPHRRLGLKVDVDTLRGAQVGVPALIDLLRRYGAGATFLFALGPDQTGRSLKRVLGASRRRGKGRPSPLERFGIKGLLYGTLLPAPLLGTKVDDVLRSTVKAGFEVGVRPWNPHAWEKRIVDADAAWTLDQMQRAHDRFVEILGSTPRVYGACGWRTNRHAFRLTQRLGFDYCADTRGFRPYVPVIDAELISCPQIPTTLPTFDELLADREIERSNVVERMLAAIASPAPDGHVLTVSADCEGIALIAVFEDLLAKLRGAEMAVLSLEAYLGAAGTGDLARHCVEAGSLPGRSSSLSLQFKEFLA